MFDADRPILSSEQDRLERGTFAKYLARCILDHTSPDSLVIGLYGGAGVGKTSVINLTLEELRFASSNLFDDEKPILLNFNAWSYSTQNQFITHFFHRLSAEIKEASYFENADKMIFLLELYISFLTSKEVAHSEPISDLAQVKRELNAFLRQQKHKLIIIIDNIARLESEEIKQLFQIVKALGDFDNTIYLLVLEKNRIIQEMNNFPRKDAEAYLEKIIQLPFTTPPISHQSLEILLLDKLEGVLKIVPVESWNKDYWGDLYYSTLKYFFNTVRDITRYVNTLSFNYVHVKEVVNPVDFFAITALLVFAPMIYYGIRDNKDLFTDLMDHVYELDAKKIEEDKIRCDEILDRDKKNSHEKLLLLLINLFPRLRNLYEPKVLFYHSEIIAANNKRICSPDAFDIYFRFTMPLGFIPESEMKTLLKLTIDQEGFALALLRLNKDEKILKFLNLLDSSYVQKIPRENIGNVIDALFDSADLFPIGEESLVNFSTPMRVHRILHQLLRKIPSSDERFKLYHEAISKTINSLFIIIYELTVQSEEHIETADTFLPLAHRDFTFDQLEELKKVAVLKIKEWAKGGRLIEHPQLLPILYAWKAWDNESEYDKYLIKVTQEDKGLLAFLCAALKKSIDSAISKNEKDPNWEESLSNIENFIPVGLIEPHAKAMFENDDFEKLREREQLAILIFLDLIKAETVKTIPKTTF